MKSLLNLGLALAFITTQFLRAAEVHIDKDVEYLEPGRAEKADLYLPPVQEPGAKYPGVVIIHGGGWTGGDKGAAREIQIGTTLASHGYVCMSINYQLAAPGHPTFPANIHEAKRAVRWLRKNAARLQIDGQNIGAIGGSAGGHLTALLAATEPEAGLDPSEDSSSPAGFRPPCRSTRTAPQLGKAESRQNRTARFPCSRKPRPKPRSCGIPRVPPNS